METSDRNKRRLIGLLGRVCAVIALVGMSALFVACKPEAAGPVAGDTDTPEAPAEEELEGEPTGWFCGECGQEYKAQDGPFDQLPADWKCSQCERPKRRFRRKE